MERLSIQPKNKEPEMGSDIWICTHGDFVAMRQEHIEQSLRNSFVRKCPLGIDSIQLISSDRMHRTYEIKWQVRKGDELTKHIAERVTFNRYTLWEGPVDHL